MVESRDCSSLLLKAAKSIFVAVELLGKNLEGDSPTEIHVFGEIDLTHTSGSDVRKDSIMRDDESLGQHWLQNSVFRVRRSTFSVQSSAFKVQGSRLIS
jgi:hypothetical protein